MAADVYTKEVKADTLLAQLELLVGGGSPINYYDSPPKRGMPWFHLINNTGRPARMAIHAHGMWAYVDLAPGDT